MDMVKFKDYGKRSKNKKWYKEFCKTFDTEGVNKAQQALRKYDDIFKELINCASNYYPGKPGHPFNRFELYALRYPTKSNVCPECGKPVLPVNTFCSQKCMVNSSITKNKKVKTCIKRYGVENPGSSKKVQNKRRKTMNEKYGVDNAFQSDVIKEKITSTMQRKYGVDNPSQSEIIKNKKQETFIRNYDETHWTKTIEGKNKASKKLNSKKAQAKAKKTCLKKYGVSNPFAAKEIQDKIKATCLARYGVENPGVLPMFKNWKVYTDKQGKVHTVQGFEPNALAYLEKQSSILRIITQNKKLPKISYREEGKVRKYYPDIAAFTATTRYLIEVKSTWTLITDLPNLVRKCKAATNFMVKRGWSFWLILVDDSGKIHKCINPTKLQDIRKAFPDYV